MRILSKSINVSITINSLVYFLIAYFIVILTVNLFSILLAKSLGFDAELFYHGFALSGKNWSNDGIILVFFFGNAISAVLAVIFERLYKKNRKYLVGRKIFYLWGYIISITWFLGNIIVGAFFNFGIGTALRALQVPIFLRLLLALGAVFLLLYLGNKAQKHVRISANLYYQELSDQNIGTYYINQIFLPALIGIATIILFKVPFLGYYLYLDLYVLLAISLFIAGLFYRYALSGTIIFKTRNPVRVNLPGSKEKLYVVPIIILILVLMTLRIGLMRGLIL